MFSAPTRWNPARVGHAFRMDLQAHCAVCGFALLKSRHSRSRSQCPALSPQIIVGLSANSECKRARGNLEAKKDLYAEPWILPSSSRWARHASRKGSINSNLFNSREILPHKNRSSKIISHQAKTIARSWARLLPCEPGSRATFRSPRPAGARQR